MDKLVINPTETAQWQAIVSEASLKCNIPLTEELESYLVFLLMRFQLSPKIANSIMALEFLEGKNLQSIGDKCLLFSGLFPQRAKHRRVRVSYFVNIGQSAYSQHSEIQLSESLQYLFSNLCENFVGMMDILQTMRELSSNEPAVDLLQAQELWEDTSSNKALETLLKGRSSEYSFIISESQTKH